MGNTYGQIDIPTADNSFDADKTIKTQARSAGDGMEALTRLETRSETDNNSDNLLKAQNEFSLPIPSKRKEPKFVPYEPYKAAVSPILPANKEVPRTEKPVVKEANLVMPPANKVIKESSLSFPLSVEPVTKCSENAGPISEITNIAQSQWIQEKVLLENRIQRLLDEKKEMETQFNVQTQVNADLKKLLVASLGEDMEIKVQYMIEDKVKLGDQVLLYSHKLSECKGELDRMADQCDLWKSKFEACRLLIRELSAWKIVLSRNFNEATEAIQSLLEEHQELSQQLIQTFSTLHSVQEAFDPSAKRNSPCPQSPWNLSQLVGATRTLSEDIQNRLLGASAVSPMVTKIEPMESLTNGELQASKVLQSIKALPTLTQLEMNKKQGVRLITSTCCQQPHSCQTESAVDCCGHCSGKVKLV